MAIASEVVDTQGHCWQNQRLEEKWSKEQIGISVSWALADMAFSIIAV